jgi:predicted ester cyclase
MSSTALADCYRAYIDCLNRQDWDRLGDHVHDDVSHNGRLFGLAGYRAMLEQDYETIPDLRFEIALVAADPPWVASRLAFDCKPKGIFLGLPVNGRRISFTENVFYRFQENRIIEVLSVLDKSAIEAQL